MLSPPRPTSKASLRTNCLANKERQRELIKRKSHCLQFKKRIIYTFGGRFHLIRGMCERIRLVAYSVASNPGGRFDATFAGQSSVRNNLTCPNPLLKLVTKCVRVLSSHKSPFFFHELYKSYMFHYFILSKSF